MNVKEYITVGEKEKQQVAFIGTDLYYSKED